MGKKKDDSRLSAKQRAWLEFYFECGFNATEAARRAGYANPEQSAYDNKSNPKIKALVDERLKEHTMAGDEVLARLTQHASSDMTYFLDEFGNIDIAKGLAAGKGHLIKKLVIRDTKEGQSITLELYDKQSALETLARHHGLFNDRTEVRFDDEQFNKLTREDLRDLTDADLARLAAGSSSRITE